MKIPYGKHDISTSDVEAVIQVLTSSKITQGDTVPLFEQEICSVVGAREGVAVNSATSAIHLAILALDLQPGEFVWTTPITFAATANCVLHCGGKIDFVDIDPSTFNMCSKALEVKLINAKKTNNSPKIVIPVHMAGQSADMKEIYNLSKKYGFKVIEDASHAIGASINDEKIGSCKYSDITVFSFHPVKIITTGEGGIAVTNSADLARKMRMLRSHGITKLQKDFEFSENGGWYYEMQSLGFNFRMTDIQAALGLSQLSRLTDFIKKRNILAQRYDKFLDQNNIILPHVRAGMKSAFHLYIIKLKNVTDKANLFSELTSSGFGVNVHYIPVHTHPFYRKLGFGFGDFPKSEDYYARAITLPLYPQLTFEEQDLVINRINGFFK